SRVQRRAGGHHPRPGIALPRRVRRRRPMASPDRRVTSPSTPPCPRASHHMSEQHRSIELAVEVEGTPEEVWRAIATGPGISSWYVPHQVEEREGGAALAAFGDTPEMQIPGRVL